MKMKLMAILVCVLTMSLAYQAASQTKPAPTHTPGSEKPKNKTPPGFEVIHCPEWMKVSFDQSKTPAGWTAYSFYENRVNALQSLIGNDPSLGTKQRVWTIPIPALAAGKGFSNVIDVSPLTQANGPWRATIDRSNVVPESDEGNNSLAYPLNKPGNPGPLPPTIRLPDLVIDHFELTDPSRGQVKIQVTNQGGGNSGPCTLRLIIWEPGQFEQKEARTVFVKVQALHSVQTTTVIARAGVPIINTKYSMYIDIGEEVKETNENNNRAQGEAGNFKP